MPFDGKVDKYDKVVDILSRALALIENPRHWCKGTERRRVSSESQAFQYCAVGAIREAALAVDDGNTNTSTQALAEVLSRPPGFASGWDDLTARCKVVYYNDSAGSHATMVSAFRRAIEKQKEQVNAVR